MESPAIKEQSEHYPKDWERKVPKRVRMLKTVRAEIPYGYRCTATRKKDYTVWVNIHGAVTAIMPDGKLGLKPDEFEIIEWHITRGRGIKLETENGIAAIPFSCGPHRSS